MRKLYVMTRPGVGLLDVRDQAPDGEFKKVRYSLLGASAVNPSYERQRSAYIRNMDQFMNPTRTQALSLVQTRTKIDKQPQQACSKRRGGTQSSVASVCA